MRRLAIQRTDGEGVFMTKLVSFASLLALMSVTATAQTVPPAGYTQMRCAAFYPNDLIFRSAIFQTRTENVENAKLDWAAHASTLGYVDEQVCFTHPSYERAVQRMQEAHATFGSNWRFELLAWSPNRERLTTKPK
jgi:hypothetical protein